MELSRYQNDEVEAHRDMTLHTLTPVSRCKGKNFLGNCQKTSVSVNNFQLFRLVFKF